MDKIPCFLCGALLTVRTDKNGKLYLVCDACGSQHFIRRKQGMERLRELGHYFQHQKVELAARMPEAIKIRGGRLKHDSLKKEVKRLDFEAGIVFRDEEKLRARDAVQKRVDALLAELERTAEQID